MGSPFFKSICDRACKCCACSFRWEDFSKVVLGVCPTFVIYWSGSYLNFLFSFHFNTILIFIQIDFERRRLGKKVGNCWISVDGTDFRIEEPTPFSSKWFSFKFKSVGLRYEVGLILETGDIAWVNGPFPAGSCIDLTIFRSSLKGSLDRDERVIADKGYRDSSCYTPPGFDDPNRKLCADLRASMRQLTRGLISFGYYVVGFVSTRHYTRIASTQWQMLRN